jgi:hypothetical protein
MNRFGTLIFSAFLLTTAMPGPAQPVYYLDASQAMVRPDSGKFIMGNPGPVGKEIRVNSQYLTIGGRPVLPVMGEVHFSRIEREHWEDVVLKMKACGITIVATYLFWNQHEEIEGQFTWEGNKDLRSFISLCHDLGMYVYPRIGPWSHGEARNGGTPDWILRKKYLTDRSNDAVYQTYVTRYFGEIARQLEGLYYKDGGPVIGIQLENEYWYAREGEPHILWLKETARRLGIDVPMYTVTGWGDGSVPPFEVIPLWGGYADEPWLQSIQKHVIPWNFKFDSFRDSENIGNDQVDRKEKYMSYSEYPYFTCEMGVGIQNTYHRRLYIDKLDGLGMVIAKLGSGSNLLGYYMFAGGTHPRGELHGTEEEQEETGYWTRVPLKSYDFQAAIRESGEFGPSYNQVKKLHYFLNEFGTMLAPMNPVLGKTDEKDLQVAIRSDNHSGFLFGINYCRFVPRSEKNDVQFRVKFADEVILFPHTGVRIPDSTIFIWPLNLKLGSALLKYATAQPLMCIDDTYIFFQNKMVESEFAFDARTISAITASYGKVFKNDTIIRVTDIRPGTSCFIHITLRDGSAIKILVLTEEQASNAWVLEKNNGKTFYISKAGMVADHNRIRAFAYGREIILNKLESGDFAEMRFPLQPEKNNVTIARHALFEDATWIESANFKDLPAYMERYHRFFFKEFSLDNPSAIRKATLYIYTGSACSLNLNEKWVRQEVKSGVVNSIDLTGYVQKGVNMMIVDFPFTEGQRSFAARIVVDYSNYDRVGFTTDASWLTADMYTNPSPMRSFDKPHAPVLIPAPADAGEITSPDFAEWDISVPHGTLNNLHALYLKLSYIGDRAELYNGHILCQDDFNDNTPWTIGLQNITPSAEGSKLRLVLYPLSRSGKIYFDVPVGLDGYGVATLKDWNQMEEQIIDSE